MKRIYGSCLFLWLIVLLPGAADAADVESDQQILHLLNRISFGPAPGDIEAVRRIGIGAYIEQQLHPATLLPSPDLQSRLEELSITDASLTSLADHYQPDREMGKLSPDEKKALNKDLQTIPRELAETKILRAIMSPAQLQEVMTDFWFNHFNVFADKELDRLLIATYERDAIRPYALGKFRDLLGATAHHPAMLFYLDNWQNTDPNSIIAQKAAQRGKEIGINENYAREIMELHTLGVDGGYTQQDVTTLAHILTGWGIGRGKDWTDKATFYFDPQRHDYSTKLFLGQTMRGGGEEEIEHVLDVLAANPATAHHISYQLAQYFVGDDPPASLVDKLVLSYRTSDGNMTDVLRTLFAAPEFWDPRYENNKFKPPFRYIVSSLRALSIVPEGDTQKLQASIADMGEPLYKCLTPNGYSNTNDQWLNSDALLKRINAAKFLGRFFGDDAIRNVWSALGNGWSTKTWTAVKDADPKLRPAMLLGSPEFLYY